MCPGAISRRKQRCSSCEFAIITPCDLHHDHTKESPELSSCRFGSRYSHLRAALCSWLVAVIGPLARLAFTSEIIVERIWALQMNTNIPALGAKARPAACGDVVR